ncbi:hypothetical protein Tco_1495724 [Tanacetum coccineum]
MIPFLFAPRVSALAGCDMTEGMRQTLGDPLSMIYTGDEGQELFTSHAMSDTEIGLDVADTLCFQLGGARHRMTWRQFILALGLHTEEEMAEAGFGAYWQGSERVIPDKGDLRDYLLGAHPLLCFHLRPCEETMPQDDSLQYFWQGAGT